MEHVSTSNTTGIGTPDLYQKVTDRIIALIEQGVAPWRRTWNTYGLARNYISGHIYTGINVLLLNNTKHPIPYFMTYNQIKERGGKIRKGSKAEMVIYFNVFYKDGAGITYSKEEAVYLRSHGNEIKMLRFIKFYKVFNIEDIEGIEFTIKEIKLKLNQKIFKCEDIITDMPNRPDIRHIDGNNAYYSPDLDMVNIPSINQFENSEEYYATLFHELTHSTGHVSRLARDEAKNPHMFGSKTYSKEELIAEMGASFLCSTVQIDYDALIENNASYLAGWLKVLGEDSKFIFKVAAQAQKATDYILNRRHLESSGNVVAN